MRAFLEAFFKKNILRPKSNLKYKLCVVSLDKYRISLLTTIDC